MKEFNIERIATKLRETKKFEGFAKDILNDIADDLELYPEAYEGFDNVIEYSRDLIEDCEFSGAITEVEAEKLLKFIQRV